MALGRYGLTTTAVSSRAASPALARIPAAATALIAIAICMLGATALLTSKPAPLTSDESLYFAEAQNIARGAGPTYTTGEAIVHRPVLYPALIAAEMTVDGQRVADAYWLPRLVAIAAALALGAVCWRLVDPLAGVAAAALALGTRYLNVLGNSLYVDTAQSLCLLLALLALVDVLKRASISRYALAGVALAAAFWIKESALLWAPLPFLVLAFIQRPIERRDLFGLAAYTVAAGMPMAAWWLWVTRVNSSVFLAGDIDPHFVWVITATPVFAALALVGVAAIAPVRFHHLPLRRASGAILAIAWFAGWLWGLEAHSWPHSHDYATQIPLYIWHVGPNVQPFYFVIAAWPYVAWRACRGSEPLRLVCAATALHLAFFVFAANRFLALRDSAPLVYLSLAAVAVAITDAARAITARVQVRNSGAWAGLVVMLAVALVALPQIVAYRDVNAAYDPTEVRQDNWDNPLARRTAAWIAANVEIGTPIMSSRLYYSSIFTLNDGNYPVHQLPTLRVQFRDAKLVPMSTQFRWEDAHLDDYGRGDWLYLRRYPQKGYDVGLAEGDLIRDLRERHIGYLVITGEDAGFSSLTYLDYFLGQPGLRLVHADNGGAADGAYIFRVEGSALQPRGFPLTMSAATEAALRRDLGDRFDRAVAALASSIRISAESGIPDAATRQLKGQVTIGDGN